MVAAKLPKAAFNWVAIGAATSGPSFAGLVTWMDTGSDANSEFVECGRNSTELGVRIGLLTDSVLLLLGIAISGVS
jgi:hypothetical protein